MLTDHTLADCQLITGRCYNLSHRCCDCGSHTLPRYNDRNELIDHDCPSPSSNY